MIRRFDASPQALAPLSQPKLGSWTSDLSFQSLLAPDVDSVAAEGWRRFEARWGQSQAGYHVAATALDVLKAPKQAKTAFAPDWMHCTPDPSASSGGAAA